MLPSKEVVESHDSCLEATQHVKEEEESLFNLTQTVSESSK